MFIVSCGNDDFLSEIKVNSVGKNIIIVTSASEFYYDYVLSFINSSFQGKILRAYDSNSYIDCKDFGYTQIVETNKIQQGKSLTYVSGNNKCTQIIAAKQVSGTINKIILYEK